MPADLVPAGSAAGANQALVRRSLDAVWQAGRSAAAFFAPGYQRYLAPARAPLPGDGQQARVAAFRAAFPDLHFALADVFAAGDRVRFCATMRGTHRGAAFRGLAAMGRRVEGAVRDGVRVAGGRFAEPWGGAGLDELLRQPGAAPDA